MNKAEENSNISWPRERRRPRKRLVVDTSVPSPCVKICQIEDDTGLCIGCSRTIDELREWLIMTREEKLRVLEAVAERKVKAA